MTRTTLRQLRRLHFCPGLGKPCRASAGACNVHLPRLAFSACNLLSSSRPFCAAWPAVAAAAGHWGRVRNRFATGSVAIRVKKKQAAAGTGGQKKDRRPTWSPPGSCAARDLGTEVGGRRALGQFRSPSRPGLRQILNKVRAVGQPASPSDHGYSSPRASSGQRCNAWFRWRKTRHRANRSCNYRAGIVPSR